MDWNAFMPRTLKGVYGAIATIGALLATSSAGIYTLGKDIGEKNFELEKMAHDIDLPQISRDMKVAAEDIRISTDILNENKKNRAVIADLEGKIQNLKSVEELYKDEKENNDRLNKQIMELRGDSRNIVMRDGDVETLLPGILMAVKYVGGTTSRIKLDNKDMDVEIGNVLNVSNGMKTCMLGVTKIDFSSNPSKIIFDWNCPEKH
jgi:hypothetical protein